MVATVLLHIDHMNDWNGYITKLSSWASELQLSGDLLFPSNQKPQPRNIFVIVDGKETSMLNEFLRRLRSKNVDVTIRGLPCKERQSAVVWEQSSDNSSGSNLSIVQEGADASWSGLKVVKLYSATRNPCSHLAEAVDHVLGNRPDDGAVIVEHIRAYMKRRDENKVKNNRIKNKKRARAETDSLASWLAGTGSCPGCR